MKLGSKILKYRKQTNLSQCELAAMLSISRQSISLWETDQTIPSLDNLICLSKIFDISLDELCGNNFKKNNDYTLLYKSLDKLLAKKDFSSVTQLAEDLLKEDINQYKIHLYLLLSENHLQSFKDLNKIKDIKDNPHFKKACSLASKKEKEALNKIVNTPCNEFALPLNIDKEKVRQELLNKANILEKKFFYYFLKRSYELYLILNDEDNAKRVYKKLVKRKVFIFTLIIFILVLIIIFLCKLF